MNLLHNWLCQSSGWRDVVKQRIPWALEDLSLGADVLEIGPGFGVTTDLIQPAIGRLTCVEVDRELARKLHRRMSGKNVTVLCEDATTLSHPDSSFDSALCFTMLHHVPSSTLQDRLLSEVARVLKPGGVFAGTDSLNSLRFRLLHVFDTMVLVEPGTFPDRLKRAGFVDVEVQLTASAFRFRAWKPSVAQTSRQPSIGPGGDLSAGDSRAPGRTLRSK